MQLEEEERESAGFWRICPSCSSPNLSCAHFCAVCTATFEGEDDALSTDLSIVSLDEYERTKDGHGTDGIDDDFEENASSSQSSLRLASLENSKTCLHTESPSHSTSSAHSSFSIPLVDQMLEQKQHCEEALQRVGMQWRQMQAKQALERWKRQTSHQGKREWEDRTRRMEILLNARSLVLKNLSCVKLRVLWMWEQATKDVIKTNHSKVHQGLFLLKQMEEGRHRLHLERERAFTKLKRLAQEWRAKRKWLALAFQTSRRFHLEYAFQALRTAALESKRKACALTLLVSRTRTLHTKQAFHQLVTHSLSEHNRQQIRAIICLSEFGQKQRRSTMLRGFHVLSRHSRAQLQVKAMLQAMDRKLTKRAFLAWRKYANRKARFLILARFIQSKFEYNRLSHAMQEWKRWYSIRKRLARVLKHFCRASDQHLHTFVTKAFHHWRRLAEQFVRREIVFLRRITSLRRRRTQTAFNMLRWNTRAKSLQACAHRASRLLAISVKADLLHKRRAFRVLESNCNKYRQGLRAVQLLRRYLLRWDRRKGTRAFEKWRAVVAQDRNAQLISWAVSQASRLTLRRKRWGFHELCKNADVYRSKRKRLAKVIAMMRHRLVSNAWRSWQIWIRSRETDHARRFQSASSMTRVILRLQNRSLALAFSHWKDVCVTDTQKLSRVLSLWRRKMRSQLSAAFFWWKLVSTRQALTAENRVLIQKHFHWRLRRLAHANQHAALCAAMKRWRRFTSSSRLFQRCLMRMRAKLLWTAFAKWHKVAQNAGNEAQVREKVCTRLVHHVHMCSLRNALTILRLFVRRSNIVASKISTMNQVVARTRLGRLQTAFGRLQAHVLQASVVHRFQMQLHALSHKHVVDKHFFAWMMFTRRIAKERNSRVNSFLQRKALVSWKTFYAGRNEAKRQLKRYTLRKMSSCLSEAFHTWKSRTEDSRTLLQAKEKAGLTLFRWSTRCAHLRKWRAFHALRMSAIEQAARQAPMHPTESLRMHFWAWKSVILQQQLEEYKWLAQTQVVLEGRRSLHQSMSKVFTAWRTYALLKRTHVVLQNPPASPRQVENWERFLDYFKNEKLLNRCFAGWATYTRCAKESQVRLLEHQSHLQAEMLEERQRQVTKRSVLMAWKGLVSTRNKLYRLSRKVAVCKLRTAFQHWTRVCAQLSSRDAKVILQRYNELHHLFLTSLERDRMERLQRLVRIYAGKLLRKGFNKWTRQHYLGSLFDLAAKYKANMSQATQHVVQLRRRCAAWQFCNNISQKQLRTIRISSSFAHLRFYAFFTRALDLNRQHESEITQLQKRVTFWALQKSNRLIAKKQYQTFCLQRIARVRAARKQREAFSLWKLFSSKSASIARLSNYRSKNIARRFLSLLRRHASWSKLVRQSTLRGSRSRLGTCFSTWVQAVEARKTFLKMRMNLRMSALAKCFSAWKRLWTGKQYWARQSLCVWIQHVATRRRLSQLQHAFRMLHLYATEERWAKVARVVDQEKRSAFLLLQQVFSHRMWRFQMRLAWHKWESHRLKNRLVKERLQQLFQKCSRQRHNVLEHHFGHWKAESQTQRTILQRRLLVLSRIASKNVRASVAAAFQTWKVLDSTQQLRLRMLERVLRRDQTRILSRRVFLAWKLVTEKKNKAKIAANRLKSVLGRWCSRERSFLLGSAFEKLQSRAKQVGEESSMLGRLLRKWIHRQVHTGFMHWKQSIHQQSQAQSKLRRLLARWLNRSLFSAFTRWRRVCLEIGAVRAKLSTVRHLVNRWKHSRVWVAFDRWRRVVKADSDTKKRMYSAVNMLRSYSSTQRMKMIARAFHRLKSFALEKNLLVSKQSDILWKALRRIEKQPLMRGWRSWRDFVSESRKRTVCWRVLSGLAHKNLFRGFQSLKAHQVHAQKMIQLGRVFNRLGRQDLARGFYTWEKRTFERHENLKTIKRLIWKWKYHSVRLAFRNWVSFSRKATIMVQFLHRRGHTVQKEQVRSAFARWLRYTETSKRVLVRIAWAWKRHAQRVAFEALVQHQHTIQVLGKVVHRIKYFHQRCAFVHWKRQGEREDKMKRATRVLARACSRKAFANVREAFHAWNSWTVESGRLLRHVTRVWKRASLRAGFLQLGRQAKCMSLLDRILKQFQMHREAAALKQWKSVLVTQDVRSKLLKGVVSRWHAHQKFRLLGSFANWKHFAERQRGLDKLSWTAACRWRHRTSWRAFHGWRTVVSDETRRKTTMRRVLVLMARRRELHAFQRWKARTASRRLLASCLRRITKRSRRLVLLEAFRHWQAQSRAVRGRERGTLSLMRVWVFHREKLLRKGLMQWLTFCHRAKQFKRMICIWRCHMMFRAFSHWHGQVSLIRRARGWRLIQLGEAVESRGREVWQKRAAFSRLERNRLEHFIRTTTHLAGARKVAHWLASRLGVAKSNAFVRWKLVAELDRHRKAVARLESTLLVERDERMNGEQLSRHFYSWRLVAEKTKLYRALGQCIGRMEKAATAVATTRALYRFRLAAVLEKMQGDRSVRASAIADIRAIRNEARRHLLELEIARRLSRYSEI